MIEINGELFRQEDILLVRPVKMLNPQRPGSRERVDLGTHTELMMRGEVWFTLEASYASVKAALTTTGGSS